MGRRVRKSSKSTATQCPLGGVDSKDSLLGANQIQGCFWGGGLGCDGTVGFERLARLLLEAGTIGGPSPERICVPPSWLEPKNVKQYEICVRAAPYLGAGEY